MRTRIFKLSIFPWVFIAVSFCFQVDPSGKHQQASVTTVEQQAIRKHITDMIKQAIKNSTVNVREGVTAVMVPLLSTDDYAKVKEFGDAAIPALREYLTSKDHFEQLLAIRLLDTIGTDAAKDAEDTFAEKAELPATRMYALEFVGIAKRPRDIELLEKIAASDTNSHVRTKAIDVMQRYNLKKN